MNKIYASFFISIFVCACSGGGGSSDVKQAGSALQGQSEGSKTSQATATQGGSSSSFSNDPYCTALGQDLIQLDHSKNSDKPFKQYQESFNKKHPCKGSDPNCFVRCYPEDGKGMGTQGILGIYPYASDANGGARFILFTDSLELSQANVRPGDVLRLQFTCAMEYDGSFIVDSIGPDSQQLTADYMFRSYILKGQFIGDFCRGGEVSIIKKSDGSKAYERDLKCLSAGEKGSLNCCNQDGQNLVKSTKDNTCYKVEDKNLFYTFRSFDGLDYKNALSSIDLTTEVLNNFSKGDYVFLNESCPKGRYEGFYRVEDISSNQQLVLRLRSRNSFSKVECLADQAPMRLYKVAPPKVSAQAYCIGDFKSSNVKLNNHAYLDNALGYINYEKSLCPEMRYSLEGILDGHTTYEGQVHVREEDLRIAHKQINLDQSYILRFYAEGKDFVLKSYKESGSERNKVAEDVYNQDFVDREERELTLKSQLHHPDEVFNFGTLDLFQSMQKDGSRGGRTQMLAASHYYLAHLFRYLKDQAVFFRAQNLFYPFNYSAKFEFLLVPELKNQAFAKYRAVISSNPKYGYSLQTLYHEFSHMLQYHYGNPSPDDASFKNSYSSDAQKYQGLHPFNCPINTKGAYLEGQAVFLGDLFQTAVGDTEKFPLFACLTEKNADKIYWGGEVGTLASIAPGYWDYSEDRYRFQNLIGHNIFEYFFNLSYGQDKLSKLIERELYSSRGLTPPNLFFSINQIYTQFLNGQAPSFFDYLQCYITSIEEKSKYKGKRCLIQKEKSEDKRFCSFDQRKSICFDQDLDAEFRMPNPLLPSDET